MKATLIVKKESTMNSKEAQRVDDSISNASTSSGMVSENWTPSKTPKPSIKALKQHKCYKSDSIHDTLSLPIFTSIKEVPSPKEESPFMKEKKMNNIKKNSQRFMISKPTYTFPRGVKERNINVFLDQMKIHQVFPSEIDEIKDIKKRNNSSTVLKLGGNTLLKRRMQHFRMNSFSGYKINL